jgi:hypothetical protein
VVFMMFLIVSSIFWCIVTLDDDALNEFDVKISINNVPKNVTFISDVPSIIHVNVRDKVSSLISNGILKKPTIQLDFDKYADKGVFRLSESELDASLRSIFGNSAQIASASRDSIRLNYTTYPGKRVKVIVDANFTPSLGNTISSQIIAPESITLYSEASILDTIKVVRTEKIVRRNISDDTEFQVKIIPIKGVKMIPDKVSIKATVEPLVLKKTVVEITPKNVPADENLMIFPNKSEVSYFVPMSKFNDPIGDIILQVDYNTIRPNDSKIKVKVSSFPSDYINVKATTDSVEFTIVKIATK